MIGQYSWIQSQFLIAFWHLDGLDFDQEAEILHEMDGEKIYKTEMKFWAVLGSRGCREKTSQLHSDAFWQILVQTSTDTAADWIF